MVGEYINPFTPTFGVIPEHIAGRSRFLASLRHAFAAPARRLELTTVLYGARGTGKTTLLSVAAQMAQESGWVVARTAALPGMLEDIEQNARRNSSHLIDAPNSYSTTAHVGIGNLAHVDRTATTLGEANWRSRMTDILDQLSEQDVGLLITVDEIDPSLDELIQLVSVYQLFVAEDRKVALLMAGLPGVVSRLLSNKDVSFLRRAQLRHIGRIEDHDVREAFVRTIRDAGRTIDDSALTLAVTASEGFAYLIQLTGYRAWDINPNSTTITLRDMQLGVESARAELESHVVASSYSDLSERDIEFLEAMTRDIGDSKIADITARLGWSSSMVAQYRRRLIEAGVVGERKRGVVGFDLPLLRDYVKKQMDEGSTL
ncbi:MAG: ATP-binding protein [Actinomycetaceae bacterium]|nr:ATP-binding protein [Actinomycetaceae bacterium]MDY6082929.1 ATP-binding protein [Actinomycetaceae bacterium]